MSEQEKTEPKTIRVTASQVKMARTLGIPLVDYARALEKLREQDEADALNNQNAIPDKKASLWSTIISRMTGFIGLLRFWNR
jgi:hypothetical protein